MREHPIIFSGPMVRAILSGAKTQTRRVVTPVRGYEHNNICRPDMAADPGSVWWHGASERVGCLQECPFGVPGDRLWVRETWLPDPPIDGSWTGDIEWNGTGRPIAGVPERYRSPKHCLFSAEWIDGSVLHWRPSIHMPRWASRITLEVTDVRVERLREITCRDAAAEGMPSGDPLPPLTAFRLLWDTINGKRAPWDSNPWVWVVEFRLVQP